jgi:hypothetical protein
MGLFELKLIGWGVSPEDPAVNAIRVRLGKVWRRLSGLDRSWFLGAAAEIAEAERKKVAWNPKESKNRDRGNRKIAISAVNLLKQLRERYRPPWEGEDSRVRKQLMDLAAIAEGHLRATQPVERDTSIHVAAELLKRTKRRLVKRTGSAQLELLADLVWLASGMRRQISERSIRRYLKVTLPSTPLPSIGSGEKAARKRKKR